MTVEELINLLGALPQDAKVIILLPVVPDMAICAPITENSLRASKDNKGVFFVPEASKRFNINPQALFGESDTYAR